MELNFKIDTDELYGEDGIDFESLLTDSLRREVIKSCKDGLASDKFKEFSGLAEESIMTGIKLKMSNFLSEDIAITDKWGKPEFVGSIEDLMKKRFDDVILRPVDGSGKTIHGCTTSGTTWIEWRIKDLLEDNLKRHISQATKNLEESITDHIRNKLVEIKDASLKKQVDDALVSILRKKPE